MKRIRLLVFAMMMVLTGGADNILPMIVDSCLMAVTMKILDSF